jgi:hypothetical protein
MGWRYELQKLTRCEVLVQQAPPSIELRRPDRSAGVVMKSPPVVLAEIERNSDTAYICLNRCTQFSPTGSVSLRCFSAH